jgi:16S rRNA G1207 methylase RsmC
MPEDVYFKKYAELRLGKRRLRFKLATDLFSSFAVDTGSALLIRTLMDLYLPPGRMLDLGCGYGPIGLSLQALSGSDVELVDKDALAIAFSLENATLNGIESARVYTSLGYDGVGEGRFDLIASNLPAKAGPPVLRSLLNDAPFFLRPSGRLALVVITPLREFVVGCLQEMSNLGLVFEKHTKQYSVFHAVVDGVPAAQYAPAFDRGVYRRAAMSYAVGSAKATVETVWGLPEFDTLSYENQLLSAGLSQAVGSEKPRSIAVLNPGQGHGAVSAWLQLYPERLVLLDRDLLSLRAANRNLALNGCPENAKESVHQYRFATETAERFDLILMRPRLEEGMPALWETLNDALASLTTSGQLLIASSAMTAARISAHYRSQPTSVKELKRLKGVALLSLRR